MGLLMSYFPTLLQERIRFELAASIQNRYDIVLGQAHKFYIQHLIKRACWQVVAVLTTKQTPA